MPPGEERRSLLPISCCQDCDASILLDPLFAKPRLRRAAALRSLGRVGEAAQEYERVVGMEPGWKEADEGLRRCKLESGAGPYQALILITVLGEK